MTKTDVNGAPDRYNAWGEVAADQDDGTAEVPCASAKEHE